MINVMNCLILVCLGAPGWSKTALPFGRYYVGSPKWNKCIQEVPDIVCVVRCLGRSVIKNVRAFNKQKNLQVTSDSISVVLSLTG